MLAKFWHELAVLAELILQELRDGGTPQDPQDTSQPFFFWQLLFGRIIFILLNVDQKYVFLRIICPNQIFIPSATAVERSAPAHEPKLHNISREKCFSSCQLQLIQYSQSMRAYTLLKRPATYTHYYMLGGNFLIKEKS